MEEGKRPYHGRHGEAVARHAGGIDNHLHLAGRAAIDVDEGHPGHAFQAVLDGVLDEVAVGLDVALVARQAAEGEPGDGAILAAGGIQCRLLGLVGVARDPVEPVGDQKQRPVHVLVQVELQGHAGPAVARPAGDALQPLEAAEFLLLAVDDLALDLGRGGARPRRAHGDHRLADVGSQLDGDGPEGDQAEHDDHQHPRQDGDGSFDGQADEVHLRAYPNNWRRL